MLWAQGLQSLDELKGNDWDWQAMDRAMTKAPLGEEKTGPNPPDQAKRGVKRSLFVDGSGVPLDCQTEGANRTDCKKGRATPESIPIDRGIANTRGAKAPVLRERL
jgi:putative transposase